MEAQKQMKIEIPPIGFVSRVSADENDRDKSLVARVVLNKELTPALDGIEEWSHIYVIFWLDRVAQPTEPVLHHPGSGGGIFATRAPIHPNPIGLTLVELVKREENILWVRGLDAYEGTPVIDIKPYPDWGQGSFQVVTDFKFPGWLARIMERQGEGNQVGG
ncbi:tRNA (N6-threonylcarbamoyladenosine(37)-N6)-methyltransferase TrmO [Chloroflexota bacterium]